MVRIIGESIQDSTMHVCAWCTYVKQLCCLVLTCWKLSYMLYTIIACHRARRDGVGQVFITWCLLQSILIPTALPLFPYSRPDTRLDFCIRLSKLDWVFFSDSLTRNPQRSSPVR